MEPFKANPLSASPRDAAPPAEAWPLGRLLRTWGPALTTMAVIFWLSSQPQLGGPHWLEELVRGWLQEGPLLERVLPLVAWVEPYTSWVGHLVAYGCLALALLWGIRRQWPARPGAWRLAWLGALLYGLTDEWHQHFVPGRHADWRDLLTDGIGAGLALAAAYFWQRHCRT